MTGKSTSFLPTIFQAYKDRRSTDVSIIGNTGTTGNSEPNFHLGLARAEQVRTMIQALGVNGDYIHTESHGENDLLAHTWAKVAEPKNRRVEVIVR